MRAVVTGCAGFVGSHLSERLVADGWSVIGVDAFTPYYEPADKLANLDGLAAEPSFDLVSADIVTTDLARLFRNADVVFHLAAQPGVRGSFGQGFDRYVRDNVLGTQRVFEGALDANCNRVVYASSSSVYGDADQYPCDEAQPHRPLSPYGVTKSTCESLAGTYAARGLSVLGLRYFTVYGPRQRPDMAFRRLCEATVGGEPFTLNGNGQQSRDFTFVADAVDATVRSATSDLTGAINIGGGEEATMNEVIELLAAINHVQAPIRAGQPQIGDVQRTAADTRVARLALGWQPQTTLRSGLAAELEWVGRRRAASCLAGASVTGALKVAAR